MSTKKEEVKLLGDKETLLIEVQNGEVVFKTDKKDYQYIFK